MELLWMYFTHFKFPIWSKLVYALVLSFTRSKLVHCPRGMRQLWPQAIGFQAAFAQVSMLKHHNMTPGCIVEMRAFYVTQF